MYLEAFEQCFNPEIEKSYLLTLLLFQVIIITHF
jgi:hypothetical protein